MLLRAVRPLSGLELIRSRRGPVADRDLCNGPGKLCQALGIAGTLDGRAMPDSLVVVGKVGKAAVGEVRVTPRVGITKAVDWPLRFLLRT